MTSSIPTELQIAAVTLADESSVYAAAQKLETSPETLHARMGELAALLEYVLFREEGDRVEVTHEGQVLIDAFRLFLAEREKETE